MESGFFTINEASNYLGVKISTLYSMVEGKQIPHYRFGRLIKFKRAELDSWVQERRVDCVDVRKEVRKFVYNVRSPRINVRALAKKHIAGVKGNRYTASHGKSGRIAGLREEVSYEGTL